MVLVCSALTAFSQKIPEKPASAEYYLKLLESSKDSIYQQILGTFDAYLAKSPDDFDVMINRCEVINKAFYDSYEEYNPNYEQFEGCLAELSEKFPFQLEVLLYKANQEWGESKLKTLDEAIDLAKVDGLRYKEDLRWKLYRERALHYSYEDMYSRVITDAREAMSLNDTLDISKVLADAYANRGMPEKALEVLLEFKDIEGTGWELSQKGDLFLKLNEPTHALDIYLRAQQDTSYTWFDKSSIAKAFVENGRAEEARPLYKTEAEGEYASLGAKIDLFMFDLKYGQADSLKASYDQMVAEDFWHDPLGKYRLQMFLKAPGLAWSFDDLLRVLLLWIILALCMLIPYVWVLPVFSLGVHLKSKGRIYEPSHERWRLKQFWILSGLILAAEILTLWLFGYRNWVLEYNSEGWSVDLTESTLDMANSGLFFFMSLLMATLFFIRRDDIRNFWGEKWSPGRAIGVGIGISFVLRFSWGIISGIKRLLIPPDYSQLDLFEGGTFQDVFLSIIETIQSINSEYHPFLGLLFVVVLVPFYEEFIFRGIFLSAMQRHIGFFWANVLQATMFALIHDNLELFIFYLAFGMAGGYLRKNSGSLAPGIVMHMMNNLIAFVAILARS